MINQLYKIQLILSFTDHLHVFILDQYTLKITKKFSKNVSTFSKKRHSVATLTEAKDFVNYP